VCDIVELLPAKFKAPLFPLDGECSLEYLLARASMYNAYQPIIMVMVRKIFVVAGSMRG
jgi:hypothetical protein